MAGNDELIYRIKFEADEESKQNVEQSLREWQEQLDDTAVSDAVDMTAELKNSMEELNDSQLEGIERLIELREAIDDYRSSLKDIRDAKKEGIELTEEQKEAEVQIRASLKNTSQEYRNAEKELIANTLAAEGTAQSYNQLREENKKLETIMRNIPLDDTSGKLEKLQERVAQNKQTMKDFNAEIGDHSLNVGNYAESMSTAASAVAAFQGPLGPIAGRISSINTTMQRAIPIIREKASVWGRLGLAVRSFIAIGVIATLATMIAALRQSQQVIDNVAMTWDSMAGVVGNLIQRAGAFLGVMDENNETLREAAERSALVRITKIALEEQEIKHIETLAKLNAERSELRRIAEDEINTHEDRIEAMGRAMEAAQEQFDIERDMQRQRIRNLELEMENTEDLRDVRRALEEAKADLIRLDEREDQVKRQLIRRQQSIVNQLEVEEERRRRNADAIREEARAARESAEERARLLISGADQTLAENRQQRRIDLLRSTEQQRTAITEQAEFERDKIVNESLDKIEEAEEKSFELRDAVFKELMIDGRLTEEEAMRRATAEAERSFTQERLAIEQERSQLIINNKEQEQARLTAIEREGEQARNNIRQQVAELRAEQELSQTALEMSLRQNRNRELVQLELEQQAREEELREEFLEVMDDKEEAHRLAQEQAELEFAKRKADKLEEIERMSLQNRLELQEAFAELAIGGMQLAFGDSKKVQIATALIDTYTAANRQLASGDGLSATIRAAAVVAQGLANVRRIAQTEIGDTGGSSASVNTGISSPMGFEVIGGDDEGAVARQVAEQSSTEQGEPEVSLFLSGDINPEIMSIKARQGNRTINTKTLTTKSRG